jgi:hypothetical protein
MSEPLPTVDVRGRDSGGKFGRNNDFARGNPLNRLAQSLKAKMIRRFAQSGDADRVYEKLIEDATSDEKSAAAGMVRVAAIKVLLGYAFGKPDQTVNVNRPERAAPSASLEEWVERLTRLGIPPDAWPLVIREAHRRKVESRVVEAPNETT